MLFCVRFPGTVVSVQFEQPTWDALVSAMCRAGMVKRSPAAVFASPDVDEQTWQLLTRVARDVETAHPHRADPPLDGPDPVSLEVAQHVAASGAHVSDTDWCAFELWRAAEQVRRSIHDAETPGIASHKMSGSTGWIITAEECRTAVAVWDHVPPEQATAIAQAAGPHWPMWLELLDSAAARAGFTVHAYQPAVPA